MANIWINVSTSVTWKGEVTGIVRTEIEIVRRLVKTGVENYNVRLFVYDSGEFRSIDEKTYLTILKDNRSEKKLTEQLTTESSGTVNQNSEDYEYFQVLPKIAALKCLVRGVYSLCPQFLRGFIKKGVNFVRPYVVQYLQRKNIVRHKSDDSGYPLRNAIQHSYDSLFSKGDVLISLGLDWDSGIYKEFWGIKKKYGISIYAICYDIIPVLFPQWSSKSTSKIFGHYILTVSSSANKIFCISECVKRDLSRFLNRVGGNMPELKVLTLGANFNSHLSTSLTEEEDPYILYVSTVETRKNHDVLYKAYHRLASQGFRLPKLICVGMIGWGVNDLMDQIRLDPLVKKKIILKGRVTDDELQELYQKTLFVVFPSVYEGYGLGVVEALSYGKAVLSSSGGSLQEFDKCFVDHVDAWDVNSWCDGIKRLVNSEYRNEKEEFIRKNYKVPTWDKTVELLCKEISTPPV